MTDHQALVIKMQLKATGSSWHVAWRPDEKTCRKVVQIREEHPAREDDMAEPGPIACFSNGEYVAMWNCEATDFVRVAPIFS